jgi:hypothetical protein
VSRRLRVRQNIFVGIAALVLPISLALAAGLLLGRYPAIRRSINRVLSARQEL